MGGVDAVGYFICDDGVYVLRHIRIVVFECGVRQEQSIRQSEEAAGASGVTLRCSINRLKFAGDVRAAGVFEVVVE